MQLLCLSSALIVSGTKGAPKCWAAAQQLLGEPKTTLDELPLHRSCRLLIFCSKIGKCCSTRVRLVECRGVVQPLGLAQVPMVAVELPPVLVLLHRLYVLIS